MGAGDGRSEGLIIPCTRSDHCSAQATDSVEHAEHMLKGDEREATRTVGSRPSTRFSLVISGTAGIDSETACGDPCISAFLISRAVATGPNQISLISNHVLFP